MWGYEPICGGSILQPPKTCDACKLAQVTYQLTESNKMYVCEYERRTQASLEAWDAKRRRGQARYADLRQIKHIKPTRARNAR